MPLYLVATPIGNLEDVTPRALRVLTEAEVLLCEDTRWTKKLLARREVETKARVLSCHEHNEARRAEEVAPLLAEGKKVALVSNAGTPLVSDPGYRIVQAAIRAGAPVVPVPGPCAAIAALSASGLPVHRFTFLGFPPKREKALSRLLASERENPGTLVLYESPGRLVRTLTAAREALGDRPGAVARELTKLHEEVRRGRLSELAEHYEASPPRGECTVLIEGSGRKKTPAKS